ncbi:MAG: alpha-glucosidase C-terminal domain-containing protein [Calditrichae bacterium]|nr:alpha-glucosidase C-terminal domain-containing protein [Calditrichota bacterium]MCB9057778.1 alpha-glucosidase C-terminal domain-containing protein [Calditrichia bacterium]
MIKTMIIFAFVLIISCKQKEIPKHPEWVKDAIFYQIFPERFNNADRTNDPTLESLTGSWPYDTKSAWHINPWTADWYKLQPWEEANGRGFNYNSQRRRFGGDIQGVIDKLDYLSDLGINTIYLNPIFHAPSLHKYDAAYYHHVDAFFGPDPQADLELIKNEDHGNPEKWVWTNADKLFLKLVETAHRKGIRIILDGVFNHTGTQFWAFKDIVKNGPQSEYKDWYTIKSWDDPATEENEFDYAGWVGVKDLPELKEDEYGLIKPVRDHVFAVVKRWMDPNNDGNPEDGIDGWRLDVAEMVSHNFWKKFRTHVKSINPEAYITGEIFWDDWANKKMMDPEPWLRGDQFDGVMNYRWSSQMTQFFIDNKTKISAGEFVNNLKNLDTSYAPETRYQLLNLMDSHDTDRLASNVVNPDLFFDKHVGLNGNPSYDVRKPNAEEWQVVRLIAKVQMTFPGPPMIYYGTESGMWGGDDPDERKPMVWPEFEYETEIANESKTPRPADPVKFDSSLFNFYKEIIHLRNQESALRLGDFEFVYTNNETDNFAYTRTYKGEIILCIVNNSNEKQDFSHDLILKNSWVNLEDGNNIAVNSIQINPKSVLILKNQK